MADEKAKVEEKVVEVKATAKAEKPAPVPVQALSSRNGLTLVEWQDETGSLRRNWVKEKSLEVTPEGTLAVDPGSGVPYGFDFARMIKLKATPQAVADELRRVGIWTLEDLRSRTAEVTNAFRSAYGVDTAQLLQAAEAWENDHKGDNPA